MALATSLVWEARSAGNINNGGAYMPGSSGTDWSQQNSPQYALTGVTSSGSGSTLLTASAATDMVGNVGKVVSGTNVNLGWFQVSSVVAGVSITFDRAVATGVAVSVVLNIGGAVSAVGDIVAAIGDGNKIYAKNSSTETRSTALTFTVGAIVIGYGSTRGDGGQYTITTSTNSIDLVAFNNANNPPSGSTFQNLALSTTAGTAGDGIHSINGSLNPALAIINCSLSGFSTNVIGDWQAASTFFPLTIMNSEIKNAVVDGIANTGPTQIFGCYIHGNGRDGIRRIAANGSSPTGAYFVSHTVVYNNTAVGVNNQCNQVQGNADGTGFAFLTIDHCTIMSNGTDGVQQTNQSTGTYMLSLTNTIIYGNTTTGVHQGTSSQGLSIDLNNAYGGNGTDVTNWAKGSGAVTLTSNPCTNPSGGDFTLNGTAGAGAACKGAAFNAFPFGTGNSDIGAVQSAGGTTTTVVVNQNITRFIQAEDYLN